jgi:hypothetical protein
MRKFPQGREGFLSHSRGTSTSGCLLFLLIFGLLAYGGFKFGEAGWDYLQMKQKTREAMNWAVAPPEKDEMQMVQRIMANALDEGIELTPRNIKIKQTTETLTFTVAWDRWVELPFYTFPFHLRVSLTDVKRWHRGGLVIK